MVYKYYKSCTYKKKINRILFLQINLFDKKYNSFYIFYILFFSFHLNIKFIKWRILIIHVFYLNTFYYFLNSYHKIIIAIIS